MVNRPDGDTGQQFEQAHELADELEAYPLMSAAVAKFIVAAKGRLTDVAGDIETQLLAMSDSQLADMQAATDAICQQPEVDLEDDFICDMVAFEVHRRQLFTPDGAA